MKIPEVSVVRWWRARLAVLGAVSLSSFAAAQQVRWSPVLAEFPRRPGTLVQDAVQSRVLLFDGGPGVSGSPSETWTWNGTLWEHQHPSASPSARARTALAYDAARNRVVLFGGQDATSLTALADTWEWDGSNWSQVAPPVAPPARAGHSLAYDLVRRRVVLFGGRDRFSNTLDETWEYDGSGWLQLTPAATPAARAAHGMAFDLATQRVVVFGGQDPGPARREDAAAMVSARPASVTILGGSACAGSAGYPGIQVTDGGQPWLGDPLRVELYRLPWLRSAVVMLGASNQMFGSLRLPFDLRPVGMPNCQLAIAPFLFVPVFSLSGSAHLDFVVPDDAGLVGARMYGQGLVSDPAVNAAGATTTEQLILQFGQR